MKKVLEILNKLEVEPSTNKKQEIIKENLEVPYFTAVLKLALDQDKSYGMTDIPELPDGAVLDTDAPKLLFELEEKAKKRGATQQEQLHIAVLVGPDSSAREVATRIVRKDLRCGVGASLVNKVVPGLIVDVPYQRYRQTKFLDTIDFNSHVVAQMKMDGLFSYLFTSSKDFLTRNGSRYSLGGAVTGDLDKGWVEELIRTIGEPIVFMGEVLVIDDSGKFLDRKTGNGIINSFISGSGKAEFRPRIRFVTWGFITEKEFYERQGSLTYRATLNLMNVATVNHHGSPESIVLSATKRVLSLDDAQKFYRQMRARDNEGAMIKDATRLIWKDEQSGSPYGVKMKAEAEAEFEIVAAYPGKKGKKWANLLGGLVVKTSDGRIVTRVGMGFSDKQREAGVSWWNDKKGEIVTIAFSGITTDKSSRETFCLDHARLIETRFMEKATADTYEYCLEELKKA